MPATVTDRIAGLTTSVAVKAPCVVATSANITLSGLQTINGVTVVAGNRVLVMAQTSSVDNGIYVASATAWARALDFDGAFDAVHGTLVPTYTSSGSEIVYKVTTADPIVITSSGITFSESVFVSSDANGISFLQGGTGAVSRTARSKMRDIVSVKDFGAVGDGVADDTAAIQAAIDYAIYQSNSAQHSLGKVHVPAGMYKTSDTIHLGYGTSFTGVILEGDGMRYLGQDGIGGTAIICTKNDRPGINIQGARNSVLRDFAIFGLNYSYVNSNTLGSASGAGGGINDLLDASWVDPALPAASSSRYAVYAGVTIDAYSGSQPGTHYPNVTFPSFLGAVAQYGKNFSSNVLLDNVSISGFVVGVANQPCDADGNGDFTKLHRVQISQCQYAVSICNTQSRLFHVLDSIITSVHTAIVTGKHGAQNGCSEILVQGADISNTIYWHQIVNTAFALGPRFEFCRGEVMYAIGSLSSGAQTSNTAIYTDCSFDFGGRLARGQPINTLVNSSTAGIVTFDKCAFFANNMSTVVQFTGDAAQYRFVDCMTVLGSAAANIYEKQAQNASCGITIGALRTNILEFTVRNASLWDLDTGSSATAQTFGPRNRGARNLLVPIYSLAVRSNTTNDAGIPVDLQNISAEDKTTIVGAITVSGRDVTYASNRAEEQLINSGGANGDMVFDDATGIVFFIRARTGSTITMRAQTGYNAAGNLLSSITKTGNFWYQNCRGYSPNGFMQGDISTASPIVTNVGSDISATFVSANIAVNDYAAVWPSLDNWVATAVAANKVTAVNGAGGTFTLNANLLKTQTKKRLPLFYRAEPPNA